MFFLQPSRPISADAFRHAAEQYSYCQHDLRLGVQQLNDLECPACSDGDCAYHIDSNVKLFAWQRNREPWREPHFKEFFAADADVQLTLNAVDAARVGVRVQAQLQCAYSQQLGALCCVVVQNL